MQIRIFTFSVHEIEFDSLNHFLRSHKIIHIEQHFFNDTRGAYWTFCVTYSEKPSDPKSPSARPRVDYKNLLDPDAFRDFEILRSIRRDLAQEDGVPPYSVFTNAELAEIVKSKLTSAEQLSTISGVGKAKIEKYGRDLISRWMDHKLPENETGR